MSDDNAVFLIGKYDVYEDVAPYGMQLLFFPFDKTRRSVRPEYTSKTFCFFAIKNSPLTALFCIINSHMYFFLIGSH